MIYLQNPLDGKAVRVSFLPKIRELAPLVGKVSKKSVAVLERHLIIAAIIYWMKETAWPRVLELLFQ
jgi:hypothetical protein